MDASTISTMRTMLATGDLAVIIDRLGVDAREDYAIVNPVASEDNMALTIARIDRAVVIIQGGKRLAVHVHGHDESQDDECWAGQVAHAAEMVTRWNAAMLSIREHAGVQALVSIGVPIEMALEANGIEVPDVPGLF